MQNQQQDQASAADPPGKDTGLSEPSSASKKVRSQLLASRLLRWSELAYIGACLLPAHMESSVRIGESTPAPPHVVLGIIALFGGWQALLLNPPCPAWFANSVFFVGWVCLKSGLPIASAICAIGAVAFASTATSLPGTFWGYPDGSSYLFGQLSIGFYLWLLSMVLLAIASLYEIFARRSARA